MNKRQQVMKWWYNLNNWEKIMWMSGKFHHSNPQLLTGREIEILFDEKCKADAEIIEMAFNNKNKEK